ncbi:MAG: hypothetical protein R3C97_01195 [Geminicoccaceae bacterium]
MSEAGNLHVLPDFVRDIGAQGREKCCGHGPLGARKGLLHGSGNPGTQARDRGSRSARLAMVDDLGGPVGKAIAAELVEIGLSGKIEAARQKRSPRWLQHGFQPDPVSDLDPRFRTLERHADLQRRSLLVDILDVELVERHARTSGARFDQLDPPLDHVAATLGDDRRLDRGTAPLGHEKAGDDQKRQRREP